MWDERKVRILDIAEELGVSTATVSYVLHGKTNKVSKNTIKTVQDKLQERGYIPNMAATLLAQNDSRIIGVIVKEHEKYEGKVLEDPFISAALNSLSDEIEKAGYFFMLKRSRSVMDIVKFASMWNLEGMIFLGFCADEYKELRDNIRIPFVVYDGFFENDRNICNLLLDDFDGGRQVGEYLRKKDCMEVICVADNKLSPDYDRYKGFCEGLKKKAAFLKVPVKKDSRIAFYEKRLNVFHRYGAVFALSDIYAMELMYFLISKGFKVPRDIWFIGYDDSGLCTRVTPALSSVRQDVGLRAAKAVNYLTKMKTNRDYSRTEIIPVKFIPRESSGEYA